MFRAPPARFVVNGAEFDYAGDPRRTLLDFLRYDLALCGTKKGCDHGQCGACTVIVDGKRVNSCLTLAVMQDGCEITTIEGIGTPHHLSALQRAFIKHDGFQCGYCTPGQICSATALLQELRNGWPSIGEPDDDLRERMSGNLCRCGAYSNIIMAIREVIEEPAA
ncbi:2Fe-2S iron-sulfur cluster-binding protein [Paracoccus laeviglucosivorans]|uniref:Xanthine dehydrogenase YagT iron-sulfur-binding subunit n=1 Tax=Paracoccus laeviglucosivorans TaxID=1197861 RepID=A0A521FQI3_9RHOB|nr:2Fe-2S iron-sulfur cluster-binding protein [Paracoccus laeviglucosivorans]SMO98334.1 xanthine dehydrogenase YagT iron-sulfur-binding subunit [Paracoccus laeviglucosivorans]